MHLRSALPLTLVLAAACGGAAEQITAVRGGSTAATIACVASTNLWPSSNQIRVGSQTELRWTPQVCTSPHRLEVYDNVTNALVFVDSAPSPYQIGAEDVYQYLYFTGGIQKGKFYKWRVRTYYDAPSWEQDVIGPWSGYAVFGIAPDRPTVSFSVSGGKPYLSWAAPAGASTYKIYRQTNSQGSPAHWATVSTTYYTDTYTNVTGSPQGSPPASGNWARYHVTSVSAAGIESGYISAAWYTTTGKVVY